MIQLGMLEEMFSVMRAPDKLERGRSDALGLLFHGPSAENSKERRHTEGQESRFKVRRWRRSKGGKEADNRLQFSAIESL